MMDDQISLAGKSIRSRLIGEIDTSKPTLVLLHGAIDCIEMWRDFPQYLHQSTKLAVVVYERWGHGQSESLEAFREGDTRVEEAQEPLDDLFKHYGIDNIILVGHSYGGIISLIAASYHLEKIKGVVSIVPQMLVHPLCITGLADAKHNFEEGKLRQKLIKYHGEGTDILFYDWIRRVDNQTYQKADCVEFLQQIACPVLQIYGEEDVFGYLPNLELSEKHIEDNFLSIKKIPGAGHYVHLEAKAEVVADIASFCLTLN